MPGTQLDPAVVDALLAVLGPHAPVGPDARGDRVRPRRGLSEASDVAQLCRSLLRRDDAEVEPGAELEPGERGEPRA